MIHTNLVVSELQQAGFKVRLVGNRIEVTLNNRRVTYMELWSILDRKFENIQFSLQVAGDAILVTVLKDCPMPVQTVQNLSMIGWDIMPLNEDKNEDSSDGPEVDLGKDFIPF